jgi:hypothetical protein
MSRGSSIRTALGLRQGWGCSAIMRAPRWRFCPVGVEISGYLCAGLGLRAILSHNRLMLNASYRKHTSANIANRW